MPDSHQLTQLFENAFTHAAIGMALVGLDGSWLRVNPSVCRLVGYSEAELLASTFQDITHPDDLDKDLENVAQLLSGQIQSYHMEKRYRRKDGQMVWALLSVTLAHSPEDGAPLYFISQIQDITARKEAEQDRDLMFELPLFFRAVFSIDGCFQRVSPQWMAALGYSREELHGKRIIDLVHADDLAPTVAALTGILSGKGARSFQNRVRRADGSYLWLMWCGTGVPDRGLGYAVAADVTPLKEAEERAVSDATEKKRLYDELEAATKEIRSFQENLVTICAWTKQVRRGSDWVPLEEFLSKQLRLKLSHGVSDMVAESMLHELQRSSSNDLAP